MPHGEINIIVEIIKKNHMIHRYFNCELRVCENMETGEKTWLILDNMKCSQVCFKEKELKSISITEMVV